jgi:capsular polysaccharide transport system permease protein
MNGQARLWRALDVQRRVIGALIMRELHTRFGRDNIGYAWIFVPIRCEPPAAAS